MPAPCAYQRSAACTWQSPHLGASQLSMHEHAGHAQPAADRCAACERSPLLCERSIATPCRYHLTFLGTAAAPACMATCALTLLMTL